MSEPGEIRPLKPEEQDALKPKMIAEERLLMRLFDGLPDGVIQSIQGRTEEEVRALRGTLEVQVTDVRAIMKEWVGNVLFASLAPRERLVLDQRLGILAGRSHTLQEIGDELGVTKERVRQIESEALRKLRTPENRQKLDDLIRE